MDLSLDRFSAAAGERAFPALGCPICCSTRSGFFANGSDRFFGTAPGSYPLYSCHDCKCVYQHPLPEEEMLASYYPTEYWWEELSPSSAGISGLVRRLERSYRDFVAADHVRFLESSVGRGSDREDPLRLLDIGCGGGTFLNLARRSGFVSHGLDVSPRAVEIAGKRYGLPVRQGGIGSRAWEGNRFDVVTMFHVLEHLRDPIGALAYADSMLTRGGSLIVQVPNIESLQARFFGMRWYGLDVPRHLINFTPRALGILLERAGFRVCRVSHFSLRDNPAAIASSIAPALDPMGRRSRRSPREGLALLFAELFYAGLVFLALPPAYLESLLGRGGTVFIHARRSNDPDRPGTK